MIRALGLHKQPLADGMEAGPESHLSAALTTEGAGAGTFFIQQRNFTRNRLR